MLAILCRKLRCICCQHSNDVKRQFEIQGKAIIFVAWQNDITFMSDWRFCYTVTGRQADATIDTTFV